jgi:hypothetical protein
MLQVIAPRSDGRSDCRRHPRTKTRKDIDGTERRNRIQDVESVFREATERTEHIMARTSKSECPEIFRGRQG